MSQDIVERLIAEERAKPPATIQSLIDALSQWVAPAHHYPPNLKHRPSPNTKVKLKQSAMQLGDSIATMYDDETDTLWINQ